eukprot:GHRR01036364.1.p1 GENE.GHRR01036364.1~~GHRR01036364.1.p1  ORF type:complete len:104 (-),score=21.52 GHRR01036364.1:254-565(-)
MKAIVRNIPSTFAKALIMETPAAPILLGEAQQQHQQYVALLRNLVQEVIELPADDRYPGGWVIEAPVAQIRSQAQHTVAAVACMCRSCGCHAVVRWRIQVLTL